MVAANMQANAAFWHFGKLLVWAVVMLLMASTVSVKEAEALVIIRNFQGGSPQPTAIGKGTLEEIFNAAADHWEHAIKDDHTIILNYGWAPVGGGQHTLNRQGGIPNRETEGTILFNNNTNKGNFQWWLDPTPHFHEEFQSYRETTQDLGGGKVIVSRVYSDPVGDFGEGFYIDLFSVALHEIGHALGKSLANKSWASISKNGHIEITLPRPFPGTSIPLATNNYGITNHMHATKIQGRPVMGSAQSKTRQLLSVLDILANAQLSQFTQLILTPPSSTDEQEHLMPVSQSISERSARIEYGNSNSLPPQS